MSTETKFPKGIRCFNKHEKAPDFVIGKMIITLNDLVQFCKENPDLLTEYKGNKQMALQIQRTKAGDLTAVIDTYKKQPTETVGTADGLPF